jgi:hypothetical protein
MEGLKAEALDGLGVIEPSGRIGWTRLLAKRALRWRRLTDEQGPAVLKALWDMGWVLAVDTSTSGRGARRAFVVAPDMSGMPEFESRVSVARRYFRTYGPATLGDLAWWSGWGMRRTAAAVAEFESELCVVRARGHPESMLLFEKDLEALKSVRRLDPDDVRLLAYEDPSVKAYFETRWRYLGGLGARSLFWYAGEALGSAWVGGTLAATWRWDASDNVLRWHRLRALARRREARLEDRLGQLADRLGAEAPSISGTSACSAGSRNVVRA